MSLDPAMLAQLGIQDTEYNRQQLLRRYGSAGLDPATQRDQFQANLGTGAAADQFKKDFMPVISGQSSEQINLPSYVVSTDPYFGTTRRVDVERLAQSPEGFQFGAKGSAGYRSEGGQIREHSYGGGPMGSIFGTLGRNENTLYRLGGTLTGAALGLASGNPLMAALLAAKGGYTGQAPTGMEVVGATLGAGGKIYGGLGKAAGTLGQVGINQAVQQQQRQQINAANQQASQIYAAQLARSQAAQQQTIQQLLAQRRVAQQTNQMHLMA